MTPTPDTQQARLEGWTEFVIQQFGGLLPSWALPELREVAARGELPPVPTPISRPAPDPRFLEAVHRIWRLLGHEPEPPPGLPISPPRLSPLIDLTPSEARVLEQAAAAARAVRPQPEQSIVTSLYHGTPWLQCTGPNCPFCAHLEPTRTDTP